MVSEVLRSLREPGPHRRALTLSVVAVLVVALALVGAVMPVPYVSLRPGPTMNTLGTNPENGKQLIEINGEKTYADTGHLNFTTVAYTGGPDAPISLLGALRDWLNPDRAVVPQETIFPKGESAEQVEQENTAMMADSQQTSVAAALTQLGRPPATQVFVSYAEKGTPAAGRLLPGDQITAVDGKTVNSGAELIEALRAVKPGAEITVSIKRKDIAQDVKVTTVKASDDDRAFLGVQPLDKYVIPIDVKMNVGDIGGPSAGLMFSLGIYDLLTPGSLTGGKFVAGTGTITADGQVGAIGGIQQKMIAARDAGAVAFLVPPGNCTEAKAAAPDGLRLIKAETMDSAIKSLGVLQTGQGTLPSC